MNHKRARPRRQPKCRLCTPHRWGNTRKLSTAREPDPLAEQLHDLAVDAAAPPCPATSVEWDGGRIPCVLRQGHADLHFGGCVAWSDPHGEQDVDGYKEWIDGGEVVVLT